MTPGQRVMYAAGWLRNTGQFTGPEPPTCCGPFARGELVSTESLSEGRSIGLVHWDDNNESRVLLQNLEPST